MEGMNDERPMTAVGESFADRLKRYWVTWPEKGFF